MELKFSDGSMIAIDTIAVENEVARNMYERSEPVSYTHLSTPANGMWRGNPMTAAM